ncbi:MAG: cytochrome P450 [Pseudomonadales bacterium]|nr:cytochrome P450 [Pseudomonadales bacterium]
MWYTRSYHLKRILVSYLLQYALTVTGFFQREKNTNTATDAAAVLPVQNPQKPEDFRPLENACFQNPYAFYKLIRDQAPVYRLPNGIFCISRYEDIVAVCKDVEGYSSFQQGAVAGLKPGQSIEKVGAQFALLGDLGVVPADVMATQDPPKHTVERKIGHAGLNARFVKSLEMDLERLCHETMQAFLPSGRVEFMSEFGWKMPMLMIMRVLGLPDEDFPKIKAWCVHGINSQSGVAKKHELMYSQAQVMVFVRYCWKAYLKAKSVVEQLPEEEAPENLIALLIRATQSDSHFGDKEAVSLIFQLLIAGSDSSATSMGNAIKMLVDNPDLQQTLRDDHEKIPAFIEEVFRLESAFQGHFRWTKQDRELHGVKLPRGSRIFLMWASGNRDERFWDEPDQIKLNRKNGKKHLTFGHGIHACLGRELARMEIRMVVKAFLLHTRNLRIDGDAPFVASMFARTLVRLPLAFEPLTDGQTGGNSCSAT